MLSDQPLPSDDDDDFLPPEDEAEYEAWFRAQVEAGIAEANDPNCEWIPHEVVKEDMARQRAELEALIAAQRKKK
ncbi:hypothetical protein [Pseudoduganella violacea]|uniref:Stability determinant n=1 Tax=Pseudoduganella violacea TaxID=1715466 RepID=A0A7W5B9U2_9BURK|nr:hypothetical protein [Pseudoduganella violacea]MBB3118500.1 hypothetical protein [Pseudoduganella violacea]